MTDMMKKIFVRETLIYIFFAAALFSFLLFIPGCGKQDDKKNIPDQIIRFKELGKYGYSGYVSNKKIFIEPQFDFAWDFSEGLAVIEIAGKQGYIDVSGETVIQPVFDRAYSFSEGLAKVKVGKKYGFIDKTGRLVIGYQYDDADMFIKGVAKVKIGKTSAFIDKSGNIITNSPDIINKSRPMNSDF